MKIYKHQTIAILFTLLTSFAFANNEESEAINQQTSLLNNNYFQHFSIANDSVAPKEKYWTFGGTASLNIGQVFYQDWAAGGTPSLSMTGLFKYSAIYKKNNTMWENTFETAYGLRHEKESRIPRKKIDDRLEFTTKGDLKMWHNWSWSALINFKTQYDKGYNYVGDTTSVLISECMAPAYLTTSIGWTYTKPKWNVLISVFTGKTTIVTSDTILALAKYGTEKVTLGLGSYVKFSYNADIMKNVNLTAKIDLFCDYLNGNNNNHKAYENDLSKIDVNAEIFFKMKINKYLSTVLGGQLIWDNDTRFPALDKKTGQQRIEKDKNGKDVKVTSDRIQIKETLNLALLFSF